MKTLDQIEYRGEKPSEELKTMIGWEGTCKYCGDKGMVKMSRNQRRPYNIEPDKCQCLLCGQRYFMIVTDIVKFERDQWEQKDRGV